VRGFPGPRFVPSPGDLSLPTACSALWLVSLFHPTAASRTLPFRGFAALHSPSSSSEAVAPMPLDPAPLTDHPGMNRLPRVELLDFEALLHAESRVTRSAVRPHLRPLPSSGSLLLRASD
jgi:hypothetical protein